MEFRYTFRNTPRDYFLFYMSNIYHQWTATVNIVFTVAAVILAVTKFGEAGILARILMIMLILLFPVLQPLAVYGKSLRQAGSIKVDTTLNISPSGFDIIVKDHRQHILWKDFKAILRRSSLTVLMPDERHAYLLPDRITGERREALQKYVQEMIDREQKGQDQ